MVSWENDIDQRNYIEKENNDSLILHKLAKQAISTFLRIYLRQLEHTNKLPIYLLISMKSNFKSIIFWNNYYRSPTPQFGHPFLLSFTLYFFRHTEQMTRFSMNLFLMYGIASDSIIPETIGITKKYHTMTILGFYK